MELDSGLIVRALREGAEERREQWLAAAVAAWAVGLALVALMVVLTVRALDVEGDGHEAWLRAYRTGLLQDGGRE